MHWSIDDTIYIYIYKVCLKSNRTDVKTLLYTAGRILLWYKSALSLRPSWWPPSLQNGSPWWSLWSWVKKGKRSKIPWMWGECSSTVMFLLARNCRVFRASWEGALLCGSNLDLSHSNSRLFSQDLLVNLLINRLAPC